MALCNPFGELSLEATQQEIKSLLADGGTASDIALIKILHEMRIMNLHLSHITDQRFVEDFKDAD